MMLYRKRALRLLSPILWAAWLFARPVPALAEGAHVDKATDTQKRDAETAYLAAMEKFDAGDYDAALEGFERSYDTVASPNSRFMIARTLARLGRNVEAYRELSAVIDQATSLGARYQDTATAARAKRDDIRPRIGLLTIRVFNMPKATRVTIDGKPAKVDPDQPVPVLPGEVTVVAAPPKGAPVTRTVKIEMGGEAEVRLEPEEEEKTDEPDADAAHVERPGHHTDYLIEVEAHGLVSTTDPPSSLAGRGVGVGGRVMVSVLGKGVLPGLNDSLAVGAGGDWVASSSDPHTWIPVVAQYNLWLVPRFSLFLEPGVAFMVGSGRFIRPAVSIGGRYEVAKRIAIIARAGLPLATVGLSYLW